MKILVTGGSGLLGQYVIAELVRQNIETVCMDLVHGGSNWKNVIGLTGDICNAQFLREKVEELGIDRIIHCAAMLQASCEEKPAEAVMINALGTVNVLEAARHAGVKRVVLASSIAVYGRTHYDPMDENHPCEPRGVYASIKLLGEYLGRAYERVSGIEVVALRYGLVYGPAVVRSKGVAAAFTNMLLGAMRDRVVKIPRSDQRIPLTYVSDAADCTVLACLQPLRSLHRVYNVSGNSCTLAEIANLLYRLYPDVKVVREESELASPLNGALDVTRAKYELGYVPQVNFEKGVRIVCDYFASKSISLDGL